MLYNVGEGLSGIFNVKITTHSMRDFSIWSTLCTLACVVKSNTHLVSQNFMDNTTKKNRMKYVRGVLLIPDQTFFWRFSYLYDYVSK